MNDITRRISGHEVTKRALQHSINLMNDSSFNNILNSYLLSIKEEIRLINQGDETLSISCRSICENYIDELNCILNAEKSAKYPSTQIRKSSIFACKRVLKKLINKMNKNDSK